MFLVVVLSQRHIQQKNCLAEFNQPKELWEIKNHCCFKLLSFEGCLLGNNGQLKCILASTPAPLSLLKVLPRKKDVPKILGIRETRQRSPTMAYIFFVNLLFVWHTALGPFTFWLYTVPWYHPSSLSIAVVWMGVTSGLGMWFRPKQWYVIQSEPTWCNLGLLLGQLKEMWTWAVKMELLAAILLLQETEKRDEERKTKSWYFLSLLIPGSVIPLESLLLWAYKIPVCLHQDNVSGFPSLVIHQVYTDVLI